VAAGTLLAMATRREELRGALGTRWSGARARQRALVEQVHDFDRRIDNWVDRVRGPGLDPVFYGLSSAADHGLLWLAVGSVKAAREGDPAVALRLGASMGIESILTNGPIKMCFRRVRPAGDHSPEGPLPYGMHRPVSSSFPSGHATSAFTAAMLLADSPLAPAYFVLAVAVASSRVYTKMHHTSDIVAGSLLGLAMGAVARKLLPLA
jgi:undecaprenyl-diphosphatase